MALVAVLRNASFERAAKILRTTPSAVPQQIRAPEEKAGGLDRPRSSAPAYLHARSNSMSPRLGRP
ncbi:LysR family transcriptional regulator [Rhizobium ruizarguesonis]|uniref:LysR family transcriptional regulator n=1 Tax=Rhizobium ruizarguesonis TaxID=2081791 RepID=UPI001FD47B70|nr:LysR family transcriptional regulator [Rhizobium ruizarguesonis]